MAFVHDGLVFRHRKLYSTLLQAYPSLSGNSQKIFGGGGMHHPESWITTAAVTHAADEAANGVHP